MKPTTTYRLLVACGHCGLQFDATGRAAGSRFHCSCGEAVEVPTARPHDAAVVRCSACGGPRQQQAAACTFCGSDFTLHERDLHTICPRCGTRISDRSRFCHACAVPIAPQALAGDTTRFPCPTCGEERRLRSRQLAEGEATAVLECEGCAGLWLGGEVFGRLEAQARDRQGGDGLPTAERPPQPRAEAPVYRPCPLCGKLMHRRNYGRRSGVIVDTCAEDGIWFDRGELERVLEWVRGGGPQRVQELEREAARQERRKTLYAPLEPEPAPRRGAGSLGRLVEWIVDALGG